MFSRLFGRCIARSFPIVARFIGSQHPESQSPGTEYRADADCQGWRTGYPILLGLTFVLTELKLREGWANWPCKMGYSRGIYKQLSGLGINFF